MRNKIIRIICMVFMVLSFTACGKNDAKNNILDEYFNALENLDMNKLEEIVDPMDISNVTPESLSTFMPFGVLYGLDFGEPQLMGIDVAFYSAYTHYTGSENAKESVNEWNEALIDFDAFKELVDFSVTYNVIEQYSTKNNDIFMAVRKGRGEDNIEEIEISTWVEDKCGVDVDEVNYVKLHIYWEYNKMPYGNSTEWWDNPGFKEKLGTLSGEQYEDYDSCIEYYDNMEYEFLIYSSEGEWHVYPGLPHIIRDNGNDKWDIVIK